MRKTRGDTLTALRFSSNEKTNSSSPTLPYTYESTVTHVIQEPVKGSIGLKPRSGGISALKDIFPGLWRPVGYKRIVMPEVLLALRKVARDWNISVELLIQFTTRSPGPSSVIIVREEFRLFVEVYVPANRTRA